MQLSVASSLLLLSSLNETSRSRTEIVLLILNYISFLNQEQLESGNIQIGIELVGDSTTTSYQNVPTFKDIKVFRSANFYSNTVIMDQSSIVGRIDRS